MGHVLGAALVEQVQSRRTTAWRRFRRKAQEVGPAYLLQIVLQWLIPRGLLRIRSLVLMVAELGEEHLDPPDDPEIRWATASDLDALARFQRRPVDLVRARMESGVRTVIAEQDGRLVGAIWYNPRSADMDDWLRFTTAPGTAWAIGTRVAPDYRGRHLFRRMARLGMSYYARAGYSGVFGWIEALNRNSLKASAGIGSIVVGRVLAIRVSGLSLVYFGGSLHLGRWHAGRILELPVDQPRRGHHP